MVRVLRPTSSTCPSGPCRISTAAASQASRCAVAAETWMPPASSSAACRFAARLPVRSGRRGPGQRVCVLCCGRLRCGGRDVPAGTSAPSAGVAASTCTTTWYRSPAVPPSRPPARARSANVPNASACRWPKLGATPAASSTGSGSPGSREAPARRSASSAASSARRTTAPTSGVSRPPDYHHSVVIHPGVQHAAGVAPPVVGRLRGAVHAPPGPYHLLHVRRRPVEQRLFGLGRRHPRDGPHLRVGDHAAPHRVAQPGQIGEGARHPHVLAGRAWSQTGAPTQPVGAGGEAAPAFALVELVDEDQQLVGGGLDACRELGDAVGELFHLGARAAARYEPRAANSGFRGQVVRPPGQRLDCWLDAEIVVGGALENRHVFIITHCF